MLIFLCRRLKCNYSAGEVDDLDERRSSVRLSEWFCGDSHERDRSLMREAVRLSKPWRSSIVKPGARGASLRLRIASPGLYLLSDSSALAVRVPDFRRLDDSILRRPLHCPPPRSYVHGLVFDVWRHVAYAGARRTVASRNRAPRTCVT